MKSVRQGRKREGDSIEDLEKGNKEEAEEEEGEEEGGGRRWGIYHHEGAIRQGVLRIVQLSGGNIARIHFLYLKENTQIKP